jgi:hypothetical protein
MTGWFFSEAPTIKAANTHKIGNGEVAGVLTE